MKNEREEGKENGGKLEALGQRTEKMFREIIVSSHVVKFDCHISSRKMLRAVFVSLQFSMRLIKPAAVLVD